MMAIGSKFSEVSELTYRYSIKKGMSSPRVREDSVQALSKKQKHPETCQSFLRVMNRGKNPHSLRVKLSSPHTLLNFVTFFLMEKVGIGNPMSPNWVRPEPSAR